MQPCLLTSTTPLKFPHFLLLFTFLHLLFPITVTSSSSLKQNQHSTLQGLRVEQKIRLGSIPPSCFNKCNNCHPCMAVQVATMPNNSGPVKPGLVEPKKPKHYFDSSSSSVLLNRYSNYKPLGWKCRCGGQLYNP